MSISKEQIAHDLAMACVNGMMMSRVLQESKDDPDNIGVSYSSGDLAINALMAYKEAYDIISTNSDFCVD